MVKQSEAFLDGEAEQWFIRNQRQLSEKNDPVIAAIESAKIIPDRFLEVGCSNGWRVKALEKRLGFKSRGHGIDPFFKTDVWNCRKGTADDLSMFGPDNFDLLIYGWCLYLCDREDLFRIACEGDRVLKDGGYLVVYDFHTARPHKRKYKHLDGLFSFKMDHANLWLGNPTYSLFVRQLFDTGDNQTSVTILRKDLEKGWPLHA